MDSSSTPKPKLPASGPTLHRALGPKIAIAVVVGNVIGSGIFYKPGNIAANCGSFWLILAVWVFGGLLCVLGALCFAELATMLPHAGGPYVYLRRAYGKLVAFLFGWTELLIVKPASIGALAVVFIGSFTLALNWQPSLAVKTLLACLLILAMTWVNIIGVVWGGRLQFATTAVKAGFLALVAFSPVLLAPFVGWNVDPIHYMGDALQNPPPLSLQLSAVLLAVMWAFDGWHGITPLAEEIHHPERNIPWALFGGIGALIFLYVAANVAYHGVLSMEEMRAAGDHAAERMLFKLAGPVGQAAVSAVIMCSTFGAINSNLLLAPRVTFAMGRDGVFLRSMATVHAEYRTPVIAILTTAATAIALVVAVAIGKSLAVNWNVDAISWPLGRALAASLKDNSTFTLLTNFVVFSISVFYLLTVLALLVLRYREPELARPYRTLGYPLTPLLFVGVYSWFLWQIYRGSPLESRTGILLILLGLPVFFACRFWNAMNPQPTESGA